MEDRSGSRTQLSLVKRAYLALEEMEQRLRAAELRRNEPVALIGIGCRTPGEVSGPDELWDLLLEGRDVTGDIPADRFDVDRYFDPNVDAPGKISTRRGAFLESVDRFDPRLFGIAPREASGMDPQQRLLLEVTWEALERAGQAPDRLEGSRTGVFVGIASNDYAELRLLRGDRNVIDAHYAQGLAHSIASGRLSYLLGLKGPSLSIDTACSSSLVAVHQACASLRSGECDLALAGGVNLLLSPGNFLTLTKSGMLAPDGRCKTFDARADGFGRGEGCGVVVLKRLSDAQADRDPIQAVIRGTAVNQDGPSGGMTAPNGPSQEAVIGEALVNGALRAEHVAYVEAHGTGTVLGDPIEVRALGSCLGVGRDEDRPLLVGSLKTNMGHLEAAAGIVGLIKTALCVRHGKIPAHLHVTEPNPHIPWSALPVEIPREALDWPAGYPRRIAGVSSFGFSGTNAHLVLEEPPADESSGPDRERPIHVITASARTDSALTEVARRLGQAAERLPADAVGDFCHTCNTGRATLNERMVVSGSSLAEIGQSLLAYAQNGSARGLATRRLEGGDRPRVAFLFTGQGAQYPGMGRDLYETEPIFRDVIDRCGETLRPHLERSLKSVLFDDTTERWLDRTAYTQPALFALELALAELWRSWGVEPGLVLGHSVGEFVAACVAGVLTFEDALRLVAERARLMQSLPPVGRMAAVFADEARVRQVIGDRTGVSIAALNGPQHVVVSGATSEVDEVVARMSDEGVEARPLNVSHAFHSPLMEPILDSFERSTRQVAVSRPRLTLISNLTGRPVDEEMEQPGYWCRHVREAVRFHESVRSAYDAGYRLFVEIGPSPTLSGMGRRCLPEGDAVWIPSMRKGTEPLRSLVDAVGALYLHGVPVDWSGFDSSSSRRRAISLPTYPFERESYWFHEAAPDSDGAGRELPATGPDHPLLGRRVSTAMASTLYAARISREEPAFLADHVVHGLTIVPATAYLEMVASAVQRPGAEAVVLRDVAIREPLVLGADARHVQMILHVRDDASREFEIFSRADDDETWHLHASGGVEHEAVGSERTDGDRTAVDYDTEPDVERFYADLGHRGLQFGAAFRGVSSLRRADGRSEGRLELPDSLRSTAKDYLIHPALLDAGIQVLGAALPGWSPGDSDPDAYMPIGIDRVRFAPRPGAPAESRGRLDIPSGDRPESLTGHVSMLDADGRVSVEIEGIHFRRVDREKLAVVGTDDIGDAFYRITWKPGPRGGGIDSAADRRWVPATDQVARGLDQRVVELGEAHGLAIYEGLNADLDGLCVSYIERALFELGFEFHEGQSFSVEEISLRLGVEERHRRLMVRFLEILAEEGILRRAGRSFEVVRTPEDPDPDERYRALRERYPGHDSELVLTARCGTKLADALTGRADALELLFPGGDLSAASRVYGETPVARTFNTLAREAVGRLVAALPGDRTIRVLEIGAGTGGTTSHVVSELPADRTDYLYTDMGKLFLARAAERFRDVPFLRYQTLDIESDPREQGVPSRSFDLVIASNVLHATSDLRRTLGHVRQVIAPGGMLLLLEATCPQRWVDLTVGFTEGWWRFEDADLRPVHTLLDQGRWTELLASEGFEGAVAVPGIQDGSVQSQQAMILARDAATESEAPEVETVEASHAGRWIVLADDDALGRQLAENIATRGGTAVTVFRGDAYRVLRSDCLTIDPGQPEQAERLVEEYVDGNDCRGVVYLWGSDLTEIEADPESAQKVVCGGAMHLVQALARRLRSEPPALCLVTCGGQPVDGEDVPISVHQGALWGLGRTIALEHPELRCRRIDLNPRDPDGSVEFLMDELGDPDDEDQVAFRADERFVARLTRHAVPEPSPPVAGQASRLVMTGSGVLDDLRFEPVERSAPAENEVEIRVASAGLNFRDVVNALGVRQDFDTLGTECVGWVERVGSQVERFRPGDVVMAIASGTFGTFVTTHEALTVPMPPELDLVEAATLPVAFVTADYALTHVGKLRSDETVLIHAAAGGVGLAAVQLARRVGARVIATAGRPDKRRFLESLGIEIVLDSRSLEFAERVRELTSGRGVDVVLNSLAGEFVDRGLAITAKGGRFLELGKTDVRTSEQAARINPDCEYHAIDLTGDLVERPERIRPLLENLARAVEEGELHPLPVTRFSLGDATAAFRYMTQARHIGKIVLVRDSSAREGAELTFEPRREGTYLVTGGLSGLGLLVAEDLAERGAGALLLLGRSEPTEAARRVLERIEKRNVRVVVSNGDVSREEDVAAALSRVAEEGLPPVRGIIHSAGVLEDGALVHQDWDRFRQVLAPKVHAAWILHRLTRDLPLDFFVLFSSVASVLGSAGQGNHAAANAFLDVLAAERRARGLPALSIGWGVWSGVGAAVRHGVDRRVGEQGIGTIRPDQGLDALHRLMQSPVAHAAVIPIDWPRFLESFAPGNVPLLLADLASGVGRDGARDRQTPRLATPADTDDLASRVRQAPPNRRRAVLEEFVTVSATRVLGLGPTHDLDRKQPMGELGLDSLMAVELRNVLGSGIGRTLPATLLFDHPTVADLVDHLADVLGLDAKAAPAQPAQPAEDATDDDPLSRVEELSDDEVEQLLGVQMEQRSDG